MPKIVVLDGYTLNSGDLDWSVFFKLGDCTVYDRTKPDEIIPRMLDAEIMITNKCIITDGIMDALPNLKYIGLLATGCNNVDLNAAVKRGIVVTNIPAYSTESVVQTVFGLLIEVVSGVGAHARRVSEGEWENNIDFCFYRPKMTELYGKRMGIVGFGQIGKRVAEVAKAFGMKVSVYVKGREENVEGITFCKTINELLRASDIVSLNCPLTAATKGMIDKNAIEAMKQGAILINTARGGLVDEVALKEGLLSGKLYGVGVDVLSTEPPKAENPLLYAKGAVITPHIGWATFEARERLMSTAAENVAAFLAGKPIHRVS